MIILPHKACTNMTDAVVALSEWVGPCIVIEEAYSILLMGLV